MKKILKTIACCLGALAIAFTAFIVPTTKKSASADETVTGLAFYGSDLHFTNNGVVNGEVIVSDFSAFHYNPIAHLDTSFSILVEEGYYKFGIRAFQDSDNYYTLDYFYGWQVAVSAMFNHNFLIFITNGRKYGQRISSLVVGSVVMGETPLPSLDMYSVEISNWIEFRRLYPDSIFNSNTPIRDNANVISYVDTNGWRFSFALPTDNVDYPASFYQYRKYYLKNAIDASDSSIYNDGYTNGYNDGLTTGTNEGYSNGYNSGYDVGFGNGRNEGIQNANNYSFLGLFGAIIDAPLTGLRSLFNFEFLGINLLSFITSLLTIALITFVIKKLMGR